MGILGRLFGNGGVTECNPQIIAQQIVGCYQQRRVRGELRVDDRLFLDLCQMLPEKAAQDVLERFRTRRSRSDPKAEYLLVIDIGVALHDAEHYAQNFKPIMRPSKSEVLDCMRPSAANTYAKAAAGLRLTDADEDAVLFEDLLKDG